MENKAITTSVAKGTLIGLIIIVFSLVIQFTMTMEQTQKFGWIAYIILFGGVVYSCILYANQLNGAVTFGNVFAHGFKVSALVALIVAIFTYISIKFIFPDMIDKVIEIAEKQMANNAQGNKMTEEQIEQAMTITRKYFAVFAVGGTLFMDVFLGAIASLVGAAVAKKDPNAIGRDELNQIGS